MANFKAPLLVTAVDTLTWTADQKHRLGTLAETADGRGFRYAQAGATALVAGNVIQASAQIANHQQLTPAAAAVGATTITVTPGATAGAANLYAEGFAIIDTTPGEGYAYQIGGHAAITASTAFSLTLLDSIQVALTTSSRVSLQANPYKNVIQSPVTTLTGAVVGVAPAPIAISNYGWLQVSGPGGVLVAGTPGVGLAVVVPATAAGAVVIDGAASATKSIGSMMVTGVDGKIQAVLLGIV
jgi:hypothetical protein